MPEPVSGRGGRVRILIVGAGFGGLNAAKALARKVPDADILVIDRRNHHLFQPLLYQVAMAGLSPADIAMPIRSVLSRHPRVQVLMTEVTDIRRSDRVIVTSGGREFTYDKLILACGAEHSYFGHQDWEDFAPGLKTLEQATEIRRRVLTAFEMAEMQTDPEERRRWLTFVVIGGGPTGVELAGALGEITRYTLRRDFRDINPAAARVILIEAGPRVLAAFDESLGRAAVRDLETLGVQVWTGCRVSDVNAEGVRAGAEMLGARTVIWAAGVRPSPLNKKLDSPLDPQGRVIVTPELSLPEDRDVFVIGDQANCPDLSAAGSAASASDVATASPLPGLAPVAMQQGRFVGDQIARDIAAGASGRAPADRKSFVYVDKGQMATIGRRRAVVQIGSLKIHGILAWWMWLVIHIYFLIGFKNRLFVLWQWAYSYLTYRRGARLITERDWHLRS